jgi:predicted amidohydrolase YtcJ
MSDPRGAPAEAIAFDAGRIVAVGREAEVLARVGGRTGGCEVIDARGAAIFPGFIDAHHHLSLAVFYEGCVPCGPQACTSVASICEALHAACRDLPRDAWVMGYGYDEALLAERRHPTRAELDEACEGRPALALHYSAHEGVASSRALRLAGIEDGTPDPAGGIIVRDRRGRATGRLIELAVSRVEVLGRTALLERSEAHWIDRLAAYQERLFAAGITRICDPHVSPDLERAYRRARDEGRLRIPLLRMVSSGAGVFSPPVDRFGDLRTGEGPEDFRVGNMKLVFDGANRCANCISIPAWLATAAKGMAQAIAYGSLGPARVAADIGMRLRGGRVETGILYYEEAAGREMVQRARNAGYGVAIHAEGNLGIARALDAITRAAPSVPGFPSRIEHAVLTGARDVARMADAGVVVVGQPSFLLLPAFSDAPVPVGLKALAFRRMRDAGVVVAGSSDAPCVDFDVLVALRAATSRKTRTGRVLHADEALDVQDALAMYTRDAAIACGAQGVTGTLEVGKRADFVVLSGDPVASGLGRREDGVTVRETWLAGERVFAAKPLAAASAGA